jgi:tRNA pseudouridine65 synthase
LGRVELPHPVGRYPSARYSLLELRPQSGRKHQIRRHLKHVFHPVVGDTTHGDGRHNRFFRSQLNCHRLLLAALRLELEHPLTGQPLDLRVQPDPEFRRVLGALGWRGPEDRWDPGAWD